MKYTTGHRSLLMEKLLGRLDRRRGEFTLPLKETLKKVHVWIFW